MKKNKRAVSLMALVITIIVMTILATTLVISLTDSDMIDKTNASVDNANLKTVQDLAKAAWSEAYVKQISNPTIDLEERVLEALRKNNIEIDKYDIIVNDDGVEVAIKGTSDESTYMANWELQKIVDATSGKVTSLKVTDGTDTIDVGTTVNYMPNGVGPTLYKGGWKILGVDEQGRLLIMSNASITGNTVTLTNRSDYINALTILQNTVDGYKDGAIGVEVRSAKIEDIDALTTFDKTKYKQGSIDGYGQLVQYSWKELEDDGTADYNMIYTYVYNGVKTSGQGYVLHTREFIEFDEEKNNTIHVVYSPGFNVASAKNTAYTYQGADYLDNTTLAYKMLFGVTPYVVASRMVWTTEGAAVYGLFGVSDTYVIWNYLFNSAGINANDGNYNVRAVVTLAPNVKLTESKTVLGTYDLILVK